MKLRLLTRDFFSCKENLKRKPQEVIPKSHFPDSGLRFLVKNTAGDGIRSSSFPSFNDSHKGLRFRLISFSVSPCNDYSGLISLRIDDWFDLLAVQGTLKSLQHHTSKGSILWYSAYFMVQLSHWTWLLEIALTLWDLCWQSDVPAFQYVI